MHNGGVPEEIEREERLRVSATAACRHLAAWWELNARDLPWRFGRTTPWGVLVSEVMSQQTQMSRVVPYWESWMAVWPDAAALAVASTAEVITAWGRLGYPRRALRLQECARVVAEEYANELPHTYEELVALPGVGDYTASAVLSFAFGERVAVIDTNIRRVLSRVFLGVESRGGAASRAERELAGRVLPEEGRGQEASDSSSDAHTDANAGIVRDADLHGGAGKVRHMPHRPSVIWNQAVMELGATVCTAKAPQCGDCPLRDECAFLAAGLPGLGERRTRPRQRFQGTDRQVRGIILNALRQDAAQAARGVADGRLETGAPGAVPRSQIEQLWPDHVQLDACIASLDEDGLLDMLPDGSLRLPQ